MSGPGAHATLSASGSARWLACTAAPELESQYPEEPASEYAAEGTAAHALAEYKLNARLLDNEDPDELARIKESVYYGPEMERCTDAYADFVAETFHAMSKTDAATKLFTETRVDFSKYVPDGFGTADTVITNADTLTIIDLKYGKGVAVSAENNSQLRLYALGAYEEYGWLYEPEKIRMVIFQPRLDRISEESVAVKDLIAWGRDYVAPRAKAAATGTGEFAPGDHCRWCKARVQCRARAEAYKKLLVHEFDDPALLTDEEIAEIIPLADKLAQWAKDVYTWAQDEAIKGKKWPGYKLVEGQRRRKITDEEGLLAELRRHRQKLDDIAPRKLLTIGKLEKVVGKKNFAAWADAYVETPAGAPTLVPATDKRPEWKSIEDVIDEF